MLNMYTSKLPLETSKYSPVRHSGRLRGTGKYYDYHHCGICHVVALNKIVMKTHGPLNLNVTHQEWLWPS